MIIGVEFFRNEDPGGDGNSAKNKRKGDMKVLFPDESAYPVAAPDNKKSDKEREIYVAVLGKAIFVGYEYLPDIYVKHVLFGVEGYVEGNLGNKAKNKQAKSVS